MKNALFLLLMITLNACASARAPVYSDYEKVEKAELVILGEVVEFSKDTGYTIKVDQVFKGRVPAAVFTLPFVESYLGSVESPAVSLRHGDVAIMFLTRNERGDYELFADSQVVHVEKDKDMQSRTMAIKGLVSYAENGRISILQNMINQGGENRRAALGAMRSRLPSLKTDKAVGKSLVSCLEDSNPLVRRDAVWLIGQLDFSEGVSVLRLHQNDTNEFVRQAVGSVLQKMSNKEEGNRSQQTTNQAAVGIPQIPGSGKTNDLGTAVEP